MRSSGRFVLLAAVALATAASLVFAVRAPRAEAMLEAAAGQSEDAAGSARRGGGASDGGASGSAAAVGAAPSGEPAPTATSELPPAADPAVLAARFAVQPGSAPVPAPSAAEQAPEPVAGGPREAGWLSYVGRVGVGNGGTLYYYKNERTGQVVTVGDSASAQYQVVERGSRTITVRGPDQEALVLESPQSE